MAARWAAPPALCATTMSSGLTAAAPRIVGSLKGSRRLYAEAARSATVHSILRSRTPPMLRRTLLDSYCVMEFSHARSVSTIGSTVSSSLLSPLETSASVRETARVGIEQHLVSLAWIRHQPERPARAQLHVRHLRPVVDAAHHQTSSLQSNWNASPSSNAKGTNAFLVAP